LNACVLPFVAILRGSSIVAGGGLLRGVSACEETQLSTPEQLYASVAIGGCCLSLALSRRAALSPRMSEVATMASVAVVCLHAIRFDWRTTAVVLGSREPLKR